MRLSLVVHVTGIVVRVFGLMFLAPLAFALFDGDFHDAQGFAVALLVTSAIGHLMRHAGGKAAEDAVESMRRVEGLAVVSAAWLLIAAFAGIPYLWNGLGPIDSMFESMSGLTTTGATIFRDFSQYGRSVFFWRAMTNWLGGMGVIALFVAVLPRLAIGGREIFFAEASGPDDEKVGAADPSNGGAVVAAVCGADRPPDHRAGADRHAAVRLGLQHVRHHRRRRLFAAPAVDRRLPEPRRRVGDHRVHVPGRRELRAAIPRLGEAGLADLLERRGTARLRRRGGDRDDCPGDGDSHDGRDRRSVSHGAVPSAVDHHDDWVRERRLPALERSGEGGAARFDVHRRLRRIGGRRAKGGAARAAGALHLAGASAKPAPARDSSGQARRPRRPRADHARRDRVLPFLHADFRSVFRDRHLAGRGYRHRNLGHRGDPRQRRARLQPGRSDGATFATCIRSVAWC